MRKIINILNKGFGADLLAIIALVGSILTAQYIAAALLVFMLLSGKALEKYASRKASSVLEALAGRVPSIAHLRNKNIITEIAITKIVIGDEIIIYPHETCPVWQYH